MRGGLKRLAVGLGGGLLVIAGLAALVLPGPGLVLCAAGLALLATEFAWARRLADWTRARADAQARQTAQSRPRTVATALFGAGLFAAGVVEIVIDLPVLTVVSAVLLILSGVFLIVTSIWLRRSLGPGRERRPG